MSGTIGTRTFEFPNIADLTVTKVTWLANSARNHFKFESYEYNFRVLKLRCLPIVFLPRGASWFQKFRDGASFQTLRLGRGRNHEVKCRQTWHPIFLNWSIENVAWIGSGFKTFIDWIEDPSFPAWFKREMYEVCRSSNHWSWFVRSPRSLSLAKQGSG